MIERNNAVITNLVARVKNGESSSNAKIAISEAMKALTYATDPAMPSYDDALLYEVLEVTSAMNVLKLDTEEFVGLLDSLKQNNASFEAIEHVLSSSALWVVKSSVIELLLNYPNR